MLPFVELVNRRKFIRLTFHWMRKPVAVALVAAIETGVVVSTDDSVDRQDRKEA